ncbi:methionine synthase (B12-independent) [Paucidesulfovibrio gracilis DSM 16080]|uniref:5-methyltetrahydropteroyltriglutamate--homocysteine methyltransferase n=1 Tax=Paucidesulfovibrio gracilis DSM 16080 TaxID=1121449 RepID=A0A1T4W8A2_9BACT|nr:5-methyltetrahydropteroyltriglutamate--homocysteine S-methyltransferase [Paucidesulfovibrio gracilis]SKA73544.1 methionine synthase (B12-independent) [Paucidesulfovibrio gracilis DSM 16080]
MNAHVLGFPRIGLGRELKWTLESYWRGEASLEELLSTAERLKRRHWQVQMQAGLDLLPVGDFSLYDHVLDTVAMVGAVPERFCRNSAETGCAAYFAMARGEARSSIPAMEMTKWFDTNYHYIVPEFTNDLRFRKDASRLLQDVRTVKELGGTAKPVLVGPITFLLLGKSMDGSSPWIHLERLVDVYSDILKDISGECPWIQIDEPVLCSDLSPKAHQEFRYAYESFAGAKGHARILLTSYFGPLGDNLPLAASLPVDGLHLDLVRGAEQLPAALEAMPSEQVVSLGLVDGRNIWRADLDAAAECINAAKQRGSESKIMLGTSCSLLHCPVDVALETDMDPSIREWMAFAVQKCDEVAALAHFAETGERNSLFAKNRKALQARAANPCAVDKSVRARVDSLTPKHYERGSVFAERTKVQSVRRQLPLFPTTTIGSFPQTPEIRSIRLGHKKGEWTTEEYVAAMKNQIAEAVARQEELGLDVLVHGEPERNDMVEYFGQQLNGFCFTSQGWVQSYGSRCVKPPVIFGDVSRPQAMTVDWARYAQSLTPKPMKGMLTGPVTILCWSFVRNDIPRSEVCRQIALAIRDEVLDLESAGLSIIQIDEAALREGLPLRAADHEAYLRWAVDCFRLTAAGVRDETQIHSHMCYSEFNAIMEWIAQMDADVISIEASRSGMALLEAFRAVSYPADVGPGVYDIHSPRVPSEEEIHGLLKKALEVVAPERLWVNPDCGLKTRGWPETIASLKNLVAAAKRLRREYT